MEILNSSAANGLNKAKKGYTLLELLAVVAFLLFIGSIAVMRFGVFSSMREESMLTEFVEIVEYIRNDTVINGRRGIIYAYAGEDFCKYYFKNVDIVSETESFELEPGWIFENDFKITFTESGAPTKGGSIYLKHTSGKRIAVTVEPANSMVRVKKVK